MNIKRTFDRRPARAGAKLLVCSFYLVEKIYETFHLGLAR
jgi:hypothetical protein